MSLKRGEIVIWRDNALFALFRQKKIIDKLDSLIRCNGARFRALLYGYFIVLQKGPLRLADQFFSYFKHHISD